MQIVEYHDKLLPSLTRLVNQQIAAVPPGFLLSEEQVAYTIAQKGMLWNLHYPLDAGLYTTETLCVLERREVVAAAQWLFFMKSGAVSIQWLVAQTDRPVPLRTLVHLIDKWAEMHAGSKISFERFGFGVGWFGLPADWKHVVEAMVEAGYRQTQPWLLMLADTTSYSGAAPPQVDGLHYYWNMDKPALEWELSAYRGDVLAGECQVWGIPPHFEDCPEAPEWATVEWIGVEKPFRRHGVGRWLLAEQMRFHARRGVQYFIAWTGQRNRAARKLNESMGFSYGPRLVTLSKP